MTAPDRAPTGQKVGTYRGALLRPAERVAQLEVGGDGHGLHDGDVLLQQVLLHDVAGQLAEHVVVAGAAVDIDGARRVTRPTLGLVRLLSTRLAIRQTIASWPRRTHL